MISKVISLAATAAFVGVDAVQYRCGGQDTYEAQQEADAERDAERAAEKCAKEERAQAERDAKSRRFIEGGYTYSFDSEFSSKLETHVYTLKVHWKDAVLYTVEQRFSKWNAALKDVVKSRGVKGWLPGWRFSFRMALPQRKMEYFVKLMKQIAKHKKFNPQQKLKSGIKWDQEKLKAWLLGKDDNRFESESVRAEVKAIMERRLDEMFKSLKTSAGKNVPAGELDSGSDSEVSSDSDNALDSGMASYEDLSNKREVTVTGVRVAEGHTFSSDYSIESSDWYK